MRSISVLVLGSADQDGRPWAAPVYYAPSGYREFLWVSEPDARHSRNIEVRADTDVEPPARLRLYRATAVEQFVLDENDDRVPVTL